MYYLVKTMQWLRVKSLSCQCSDTLQHTKLNPVIILNKQRFVNATFNSLLLFVISDALFFYVLLLYSSVFRTIFGCQSTSFVSVVSVAISLTTHFSSLLLLLTEAFLFPPFPWCLQRSLWEPQTTAAVLQVPVCLSICQSVFFVAEQFFFSWLVSFTHVFRVTSYICTLWHFVFPFCFISV